MKKIQKIIIIMKMKTLIIIIMIKMKMSKDWNRMKTKIKKMQFLK